MRVSLCGSSIINASSRLHLDWFSWYLSTMITRWETTEVFRNWGQRSLFKCSKRFFVCIIQKIFYKTWVKRSLAKGYFGVFRNFISEVILWSFNLNLGSDFQNAPIGLKLDMDDLNNILNRLKLLLRSSKVKDQLGVKYAICSDFAQFWTLQIDWNYFQNHPRPNVFLRSDFQNGLLGFQIWQEWSL